MNNSIHIPKPCHENWDNMLPETQGRHCLSCCKTVIDFSTWDNESILAYLQNKNGERVCGRFNAEQVTPEPSQQELLQGVMSSAMPLLRKIAAVIVLCFGLSYAPETHAQKVMGKMLPPPKQQQQPRPQLLGEPAVIQPADTAKPQPVPQPQVDTLRPQIMGMIMPYHPPKEQPKKKASKTTKKPTR